MATLWRKCAHVSALLVLAIPVTLTAQDKRDQGKLSSELHRLAVAAERGERLSARGSLWVDESRQMVTAVIVLTPESRPSDVEPAVRAAGGTIEASSGELVKVELPAGALRNVSNHPSVLRMRTPFKPNQKVTSQGVDTIHAPDYRNRKGVDGAGVAVGILDTGFKGAADLLGGELPADTLATDFVLQRLSQFEEVHGTACAEIIHDVAPGATLVLAAFEDEVSWGAAVDELVNLGVDIISHSVGFDNVYSPDGNHFFAQKVDEANSRGVLFVTAGGNEADKYFQGPWRDDNGNGYLDVPGGEVLPVAIEGGATIVLRWDDAFGGSFHDYDLLVVTEAFLSNPDLSSTNPAIIASSADLQSGAQNPVERVDFEYSGIVFVLVLHDANSPLNPGQRFWVWSSAGIDPSQGTGIGTLTLPADARGGVAVAAVGFDTRTLEGFSSRGPTADGRVKPDVAGPDRVSTASYGEPFLGTSAATPHVSGAAALILSANPGMSASDLRRALEEAVDLLGYPGRNNDIGAGLIDLHSAR
jgi:subtilisin family serine protease